MDALDLCNTWLRCCCREGGTPPLYRQQDHNTITCATRTINTINSGITRRRHQPYASRALQFTVCSININITCATHVKRGHRARHMLGGLIYFILNTIPMPLWLFYDLVSVLSRALIIVLTLGFKILSRMIVKVCNLHNLINSIDSRP